MPGRRRGDTIPLTETIDAELIRTRSGLLVQPKDRPELAARFPPLLPLFDAGLRSFLSVPLISRDETIGCLHLRSARPNAYTERHLELAKRVGLEISGNIAAARLHRELQQAKEAAEAASRAKGDFLANMSHEIRTPLNGVIGVTELMLDTQLTAEQAEYLDMVRTSADSLSAVIDDILDLSKIEAGKLDFDFVDFSLRSSLGHTMQMLALRARQKGLRLAWHVQPDVPDALMGDPGRLRQTVVNLVGNAIKFTDRGSVMVQVEVESQDMDLVCLHFGVTDTGIGVPPDRLAAIFDAFSQVDGSNKRQYGGTGLGLTITSQLVDMMGGRVWVESEVGQGSTFHFTASFCLAKTEAGPTPSSDVDRRLHETRESFEEGRPPLHVLLAEDNPVNQKLEARLLEKRGHTVVVAEDGSRALSALETGRFDLILMDVQMPNMDGLEATAAIRDREKHDGSHIPIIAMTAGAMKGDRERCLEMGMDAYLSKPIQPAELFQAIESVVSKPAESDRASEQPKDKPIDLEAALALAGDEELLKEIAEVLLENCPRLLNDIKEAIASEDSGAVELAAHSLRGSVGFFSAEDASDAALALEVMGRSGDLTHAEEAYTNLQAALDRLQPALSALGNEATP